MPDVTDQPPSPETLRQFPCRQCGARLEYKPGSDGLVCPYCNAENRISVVGEVQEQDYRAQLAQLSARAPRREHHTVKCDRCAAVIDKPPNVTAMNCPFCGASIVATARATSDMLPGAILPFAIAREQAVEKFREWVRSRWFAPTALKRESFLDATVSGTYLPAWTYDAATETRYSGQRGDAYYVTQTVIVNGKAQARQVRKIRWSAASGVVNNRFDDVLVMATRSLPSTSLEALAPWDLRRLSPYDDSFLAGFRAEQASIGLADGFEIAKEIMRPTIERTIRADIGGDEQRILSMSTRYDGILFKHILLPVWISAYRFHNRVFRFLVNARTGEVVGERPWSATKIALLVLVILIVIGLVVLLVRSR